MTWQVRTLPDRYADSVRLMGIARALRDHDGVSACEVVMGTPANLSALAALGASVEAGPGDVVVAVDGEDGLGDVVLAEVQRLLVGGGPQSEDRPAPARTLAAVDAANIALISVPGEYATLEAHRALTRGLHVFLFSDHVALEDEIALKRRGAEHGLLVMGPECGTAMLAGVGLGFANVVRAGPVGVVAAAGTGAQEVACLIDAAGSGVSHIIGVGGRDLSAAVGGTMVRQGLAMLARDDHTETLLLVAKEPEALDALAGAVPDGRRAVAALVGWEGDLDGWEVHPTLEAAALAAAGATRPIRRRQRRAGAPGARPRPLLGRLARPRGVRRARSAAGRRRDRARGHRGGRPRGRRPRDRALHAGAPAPDGRPGHPAADARGSGRRRPHGVRPARRRLRPRRARRSRLRAGGRDCARWRGVPRWWCASAGPTPTRRTRRARPPRCGRRRGRRAVQRRGSAARREGDRVRIAMLTYSVRPRGGVVHALSVAGALADRGHEVELFAIGPPGTGFFRPPPVPAHVVAHVAPDAPFDERICALIDAYAEGLREPLRDGGYDVVHAQDCISANAALTLRDEGVVDAVVRTVHHVDDFRSPSLIACQERSIVAPDRLLVVSTPWIARLRDEFGVEADLVPNGVDTERFRPPRDAAERAAARDAAGLDGELAILTVGGIEPRKGSLTLLRAFAGARRALPERRPVLLVAGGATLFDHRDEIDRFHALREELDLGDSVRVLGPVTDAELESLYRAADLFALPSTKEGFGLAVLEALAAGLPAVVSDLDVFRTYLSDGDSALMAPVGDHAALADALVRAAVTPGLAARLRDGGRAVAARHGWDAAAAAHETAYARFMAMARG